MIDTAKQLEIYYSPWRLVGLGLLGTAMTACSAALAYFSEAGSFAQFISYFATIFFGACTVLLFWRTLSASEPVITIRSDGIRDKRVAEEFILWTVIESIGTWNGPYGQSLLVLSIPPDVEARLTLTRATRWSRSLNAAVGADGLVINPKGLKINEEKLLETIVAYTAAAQGATVEAAE